MHIEKRGNSLLIRFSHDGNPYSFSLPKHNNPVGMSAAKMKMAQIEKDINYGNFDTTLLRYKPRKLGNDPTVISAIELFEKYIPFPQQERGITHGSGNPSLAAIKTRRAPKRGSIAPSNYRRM